jgi:hypothetical protein
MAGPHENLEHVEHAEEASHGGNKKIALLISVLALFLALSETLGKSAQTNAITLNVAANDLWAFFQAKTIRITVLTTAAEQMQIEADRATDADLKARLGKNIDTWKKNAARYEDDAASKERAASSFRRGPRTPSTNATRPWRATTNTKSHRRRSRSASCWRRPKSSPAWSCWDGCPVFLG